MANSRAERTAMGSKGVRLDSAKVLTSEVNKEVLLFSAVFRDRTTRGLQVYSRYRLRPSLVSTRLNAHTNCASCLSFFCSILEERRGLNYGKTVKLRNFDI